jgi:hypothetical protein
MNRPERSSSIRFNWWRNGYPLPLLVGIFLIAMLLVMWLAPWWSPTDAWKVRETLTMWAPAVPFVLAFAIGRAWSVAPFVAMKVRATEEMVSTRMKAAGIGTVVSWVLTLVFLAVAFPMWRDTNVLPKLWIIRWQYHDRPVPLQYAIGAVSLVACMLLTWRFLVRSMWLGLTAGTGARRLSAALYVLTPILAIGVAAAIDRPQPSWVYDHLDGILSILIWIAALGAMAKLWFSAFSWRKVAGRRVRRYLVFWTVATACVVTFAIELTPVVWGLIPPSNPDQARTLLILAALMTVPLARPGIVLSSVERNGDR